VASERGHVEVVKMLLDGGANIEIQEVVVGNSCYFMKFQFKLDLKYLYECINSVWQMLRYCFNSRVVDLTPTHIEYILHYKDVQASRNASFV
jgi:hypothetical protein